MTVEPTRLPGVVVVSTPVYSDERGFFTEVFQAHDFAGSGLPATFAQDSHSRSRCGVLRGIHYQLDKPQGKLVRPVCGSIFDVAIDLRRSSPHFGRWAGVTLHAGDGRQLWIPPGFGHAFLVLSDSADVTYKCTTVYEASSNHAIKWDDATLAIEWPLPGGSTPLLSTKDAVAPSFESAVVFD